MNDRSDKTQYVIFHHPGRKWRRGRDLFEQDGVQEHVQHYAKLLADGKLAMGGPFLTQDRGGMMVASLGVGKEELEAFALADPAVQSGLLSIEVLPWYLPMKKE